MDYALRTTSSVSLNFHLLAPCNMRCEGCFSHLERYAKYVPSLDDAKGIIDQLVRLTAGYTRKKLTFSGGEPTLLSYLPELIGYSRSRGFTTSLISNGSRLSASLLKRLAGELDWLGISVDSLSPATNTLLGRTVNGHPVPAERYLDSLLLARHFGIRTKLNTVVSRANLLEDFSAFLDEASPDRWKVMQALILEGENDAFGSCAITASEFMDFVARHQRFHPVAESAASMIDSYAMISPRGEMYGNANQSLSFGRRLVDASPSDFHIWYSRLRPRMALRGGEYAWESPSAATFGVQSVGGDQKVFPILRAP